MSVLSLKLPISVDKEDDLFVATCHVFHVASQGKTEKEALVNVKEALELFLEDEDVQEEHAETIKEYMASKHDTMLEVEIHEQSKFTHTIRS